MWGQLWNSGVLGLLVLLGFTSVLHQVCGLGQNASLENPTNGKIPVFKITIRTNQWASSTSEQKKGDTGQQKLAPAATNVPVETVTKRPVEKVTTAEVPQAPQQQKSTSQTVTVLQDILSPPQNRLTVGNPSVPQAVSANQNQGQESSWGQGFLPVTRPAGWLLSGTGPQRGITNNNEMIAWPQQNLFLQNTAVDQQRSISAVPQQNVESTLISQQQTTQGVVPTSNSEAIPPRPTQTYPQPQRYPMYQNTMMGWQNPWLQRQLWLRNMWRMNFGTGASAGAGQANQVSNIRQPPPPPPPTLSPEQQRQQQQMMQRYLMMQRYRERLCNQPLPGGLNSQVGPYFGQNQMASDPRACHCYPRSECESQAFMYINPRTTRECNTAQTAFVCCCEDRRPGA